MSILISNTLAYRKDFHYIFVRKSNKQKDSVLPNSETIQIHLL